MPGPARHAPADDTVPMAQGNPVEFAVVLRGYDRHDVDVLLQQANLALLSTDPAIRAAAKRALKRPTLRVRLRGYDRGEVDRHCRRLFVELRSQRPDAEGQRPDAEGQRPDAEGQRPDEDVATEGPAGFSVVLRGYDRAAVDALVQRANDALGGTDAAVRAAVRTALRSPAIPVVLRGYDRHEVDAHLQRLASRLG
jgi:hypothetical protein